MEAFRVAANYYVYSDSMRYRIGGIRASSSYIDLVLISGGKTSLMFLIWEGYGWLVLATIITSGAITRFSVDSITGIDGYFNDHQCPQLLCAFLSSAILIPSGVKWNKRE